MVDEKYSILESLWKKTEENVFLILPRKEEN